MIRNVYRYAIALTICMAGYWVYALLVTPWVEPTVKPLTGDAPSAMDVVLSQSDQSWKELFPEGSWELTSPKELDADSGKLLFKDAKPQPNGSMKVTPFTLIFYPDDEETTAEDRKEPIVLRAPEGAVLNFDGEIDWSRGKIGRLIGGRLLGDVHIYSPSSEGKVNADGSQAKGTDRFDLYTKHVQITESRVWTVHPVQFRLGRNYCQGRDLTMVLEPSGKAKSESSLALGRPKSLELVQVDKFVLYGGGDIFEGNKDEERNTVTHNATHNANAQPKEESTPVEVTCEGPFQFDFVKNDAWFNRNVYVLKHYLNGPSDSLACQHLMLDFAEKSEGKNDDGEKSLDKMSGLEVKRMVAVGAPVQLEAPSRDASARGEFLEYNRETNRVHLASEGEVSLRQKKRRIYSRQIEYELTEDRSLGRVWAEGPGRVSGEQMVKDKGQLVVRKFNGTWQNNLRIEPDDGQHLLTLEFGASMNVPGMGGFRAKQIFVWFNETEASPETQQPIQQPSQEKSEFGDMQIDRLLAIDNVHIDAPELTGDTDRLEAYIRQDPTFQPPVQPLNGQASANFNSQATAPVVQVAATNHAVQQVVWRPNYDVAVPSPSATPIRTTKSANEEFHPVQLGGALGLGGKSDRKFNVLGKLIRLQIVQNGKQSFLEKVTLNGEVVLTEISPTKPGEQPLRITGEALEVTGADMSKAFMQVIGAPATISASGMEINGENIQLNRGDNRMWINGPGDMTLPAAKPKANKPSSSLGGLANFGGDVGSINISWKERMDFDGSTARFVGAVKAKGESQFALTGQLDVTMNKRVDFSADEGSQDADPRRLVFHNGVYVENRAYEAGRLDSFDRMQFASLLLDQLTGELHADGPGWLSSVRFGAPGGFGAPGAARPTSPSEGAKKLSFTRVEFQKQMIGDTIRKEVDFYGRVKAVYGPVTTWDEQLEVDRPETLGERGVQITADQLGLSELGPQITPDRKALEMEANGNVFVEGTTFTARSKRLTYSEAKDLLVLEGDRRNLAQIDRQARIGGKTQHAAALKVYYWKSEDRVKVDDAKELDLSDFGSK